MSDNLKCADCGKDFPEDKMGDNDGHNICEGCAKDLDPDCSCKHYEEVSHHCSDCNGLTHCDGTKSDCPTCDNEGPIPREEA